MVGDAGRGPAAGVTVPGTIVSAEAYRGDPWEVAPQLLNKVLVRGRRAGRIVEVEAYAGRDDPASHAFRGPTDRTAIMFGPVGRLYVYRSYGIHWCANVVAHPHEEGAGAGAVLIRAVEPIAGVDAMWADRPAARRPEDLASGPGKVCQALGIDDRHGGVAVHRVRSPVRILDDGTPPPAEPEVGQRVGINRATERPWRFSVPGHPHRSRAR